MSTPGSNPYTGSVVRSSAAPYAIPQPRVVSDDRAPSSVEWYVGPYVPAPWRGTPSVAAVRAVTPLSVTPLSVTPLSVTPLSVTPLSVTPLSVTPLSVIGMPPSYPTPAYFNALGSPLLDDVVETAFNMPVIVHATAEEAASAVSDPGELFAEPNETVMPEAVALPWIDAFLSTTPAIPMRSVDERVASLTAPSTEAIVDEAAASVQWPPTANELEAPTPSDAWALDDAAEQLRALADELRERDGISIASSETDRVFEGAPPPPSLLPSWGDDDLIDIMPMQTDYSAALSRMPTPASFAPIAPWADRARQAGDESSEAAARALEVLARRVRDGELSLVGYEPRLGDAAALAAALAALLGVRR
jgi:hypothetical protein